MSRDGAVGQGLGISPLVMVPVPVAVATAALRAAMNTFLMMLISFMV